MNEEERKIVDKIVWLHEELCKLTYEGSKGAHGVGLPSIGHYIHYAEIIREQVVYLFYDLHSNLLSKSNLLDLDEIFENELRKLRIESKKMSEQKLIDRLELITNLIGSAITPLLKQRDNC